MHLECPSYQGDSKKKIEKRRLWIPFLSFLIPFLVYTITCSRTIPLGDSGEFIIGACTLGIGHPPGFPLYMLLGKLFCLLPIGSHAFRVNLMSGFFGATTCCLTSLILMNLRISPWTALISGLALAFSGTFWAQSVVAEVYTLSSAFMAGIILALVHYGQDRKKTGLYLAAFLWGLSLTNHWPLIVVATPGWVVFLFWDRDSRRDVIRSLPALLFFVGMGLIPYLYLPLRASVDPPLNWGDPDTLRSFVTHVLRLRTTETRGYWEPMATLRVLVVFVKEILLKDWVIIGTVLASWGFYEGKKKDPRVTWAVTVSWLSSVLVILSWVRVDVIGVDLVSVFSSFATLAFFQAILLGFGLDAIERKFFSQS